MAAFDFDDPSEFFDADWTEPVTYNAVSYNGIRFKKENSRMIMDAGLSNDVLFSFMFKVSDFSTLPKSDELMTFASVEYRIVSVEIDSTNKTFNVELGDKYAN